MQMKRNKMFYNDAPWSEEKHVPETVNYLPDCVGVSLDPDHIISREGGEGVGSTSSDSRSRPGVLNCRHSKKGTQKLSEFGLGRRTGSIHTKCSTWLQSVHYFQ